MNTNLYLITIFTPPYKFWYSSKHIHSQFNMEGTSKSQILSKISLQIKQLKSTNKYTHFTIEEY